MTKENDPPIEVTAPPKTDLFLDRFQNASVESIICHADDAFSIMFDSGWAMKLPHGTRFELIGPHRERAVKPDPPQ